MRTLVIVYYQLGKNAADNLKTLQDRLAFFYLKHHKIWSLIV